MTYMILMGFSIYGFSVENDMSFSFLRLLHPVTRHFSIFPQLCRPGTVRRHVHFEDDAVLSEGVAKKGPADPVRTVGTKKRSARCFLFLYLVGGKPTPLKKYESQWEGLSHILWKIKNV